MASANFIQFYNNDGNNMNLEVSSKSTISLYDNSIVNIPVCTGNIYLPKVSVGLIESQQIFLLQEVTGPTSSYNLRKIKGSAQTVAGNSTVTGLYSDFSSLKVGMDIKIGNEKYNIESINSDFLIVSPTPSITQETDLFYLYDYLSYNELRSEIGTYDESIRVSFENSTQTEFFIYDIDYTEEYPIINKNYNYSLCISNGSNDTLDNLTNRIKLSSITTHPNQINLGFSSGLTATYGNVYEETMNIVSEKTFSFSLLSVPTVYNNSIRFIIGGTAHKFYQSSTFYLQGITGANSSFFNVPLTVTSTMNVGSNTYVLANMFNIPAISTSMLSMYNLVCINNDVIAVLNLYAETEGEDERFKQLLENFGKKLDHDQEYIFNDSDIDEDLPDYVLLNKKRKELLLEGDNIYPYIGSYKGLINIINYFGYTNLTIKEYFLNVDMTSINYDKYLHVPIPGSNVSRNEIQTVWEILPSNIYKKTSLFGLFYNINTLSGTSDEYGIPNVIDVSQFSPEEVLIKLYGLKELLKSQFLPINAKIYDITGEGIYFKRIRIDVWSNTVNTFVINIGGVPDFSITPSKSSYITDLRRIDDFYVEKFTKQGLSGFISLTASSNANITLNSSSTINSLDGSLSNYNNYSNISYNEIVNPLYEYMPPSIYNKDFNYVASTILPLTDEPNIVAGAPILLEAFFNLSWTDLSCSWLELAILDKNKNEVSIQHWTWDNIGLKQNVDIKWVIEKNDAPTFFFDSGRIPIDSIKINDSNTGDNRYLYAAALPYSGNYSIGLYCYDITNNFSVSYTSYKVESLEIDFASIYKIDTIERTWYDFSKTELQWENINGSWFYPIYNNQAWSESNTSWESLEFSSYKGDSLIEQSINNTIAFIDRTSETVSINTDITNSYSVGDYLFFNREDSEVIKKNILMPLNSLSHLIKGTGSYSSTTLLLSGSIGTNIVSTYTLVSSIKNYKHSNVSPNSQIFINGNWYTVDQVSLTSITLKTNLLSNFSNINGLIFPSTGLLTFPFSYSSILPYTRMIVTSNPNFDSLNPNTDYYEYVDTMLWSYGNISVTDDILRLQQLIQMNSSVAGGGNVPLYISWGFLSGNYAIEISHINYTGGHTIVKLNDVNKYLYNIDSNFSISLAEYDVNVANKRIGVNSTYENSDELNWNNVGLSWCGLDFHGGALCGFIIPYISSYSVQPSITIDDNETFILTGSYLSNDNKSMLHNASIELNNSENSGVKNFTYNVLPMLDTPLCDDNNVNLTALAGFVGDTTITLSGIPSQKFSILAEISVTISDGIVTDVNIDNTGWGYTHVPEIIVVSPGGTGTAAIINCAISNGSITSVDIFNGGSGYLSTPIVTIQPPYNYKPLDNAVWTGYEWIQVSSISSNILYLCTPLKNNFSDSTILMTPYQYHKQQFIDNHQMFNQHYYFIHAEAKTPGSHGLSYIAFNNGFTSEWINHERRTYSYPLRNSLYFSSVPLAIQNVSESLQYIYNNLENDILYRKWIAEGSDYPSTISHNEFASRFEMINNMKTYFYDNLYESYKMPFSDIIESSFNMNDVKISTYQQNLPQNTHVVFTYDVCKIPGKNNPIWNIYDENTGTIEVITSEKSFMWNFCKAGNFTVSLELSDSNGNISTGKKTSFIVI